GAMPSSGYSEGLFAYQTPAIYYAMKRYADGLQDSATGEFNGISTVYEIDGVPAFVTPAPLKLLTPDRAAEPKRVLLLTHNTFYNHSNLEAIEDVLPDMGKTGGFTVTSLQGYKETLSCTLQKPCTPDVVDLSAIT